MKILKRNGKEVDFDISKIILAIEKAAKAVEDDFVEDEEIKEIAEQIKEKCLSSTHVPNVEEISDDCEKFLTAKGHFNITKAFIIYRYKRMLFRKANTTDDSILAIVDRKNENVKDENSNKNAILNSTQRDYIAGEVSKDLTMRVLLTDDIVAAHKDGQIHFHDSDYFLQKIYNCCLVNMEDMLQNGTVINNKQIRKPKSFEVACNVMCQIISLVASNQYGGQTVSLKDIVPFIDVSRQKITEKTRKKLKKFGIAYTEKQLKDWVEMDLADTIKTGVQTIQYQLLTLMTTNGQAPFVSIFMDINEVEEGQARADMVTLIHEIFRQRIEGIENEQGVHVTPAFPKLLYVLDENNAEPGSKYWDLTIHAAQCTAKRMVPDYISAKKMREYKNGDVYPCMGCRSFLTVDRASEAVGNVANALNYKEGQHKYYGRFNQGVVTLNLVDVACSSGGNDTKFWQILDERLELCHKALRMRHERLLGTPSDVAPILFQYGAIARLKKGETIDKLLYNGYSTISLGYAGLYECTKYMTGASHTGEGKQFAIRVMQALNDACTKWKDAENIDYSVYGTPLESTTYKFATALQRKFGIIEGVTDKNYITNSYHVHVTEEIGAIEKLNFESEFQKLSPGGAISYVEIPDMTHNIEALLTIITHMYHNIMYAEANSKSDYCMECGYEGEIRIVEDGAKLVWECPCCGNRDQNKMSVSRRTCGYIGENYWNQGRTQEIKERVLHVSHNFLAADTSQKEIQ